MLQLAPQQGRVPAEETKREAVYADVYEMSMTAQAAQLQIGDRATYALHMWRTDYRENYTHAEVHGVMYKIDGVYSTDNARVMKLVLTRG